MGLNSIKENIKIMASKAVCLAAAGWCILLNKIYAQADLILGNPNIEYAMEESVTTKIDIIVVVIIAVLAVLGILGIYRMKKKAKQDELDNETRMIQNKKEQDL